MGQTFRDLRFYQIGMDLLVKIERLARYLPKSEQYRESDQIKRSAKSIVSNIAEGFGRKRNFVKTIKQNSI